jgi:peptidoglycan/LPS O-acetylase OafA/YrhL
MIKKQRPVVPLGVGTQLTYMPALDGIRAVSILGIMANHGGFGWATGGIISVNVFFVLSGFLITLLLMKEWTRSGTIRLRAFWARRARRLLPALFVLLGAIGLYALLFAPGGTQGSIRADGLSTLLYFSNWHEILANHSYFAQVSAPSPLLHTWTLAIEEQFYLVWPIVVVCVLKLSRSPRVLFLVAALGVLASAAEMALLFHPGSDPSRIYYGTDTRAQDILTGAALGILLYPRQSVSSRRARAGCSWMVVLAAAVFVWEWTRINGSPDIPYRGGFLLANVMVALVICGVTMAPASLPARVLSVGPLTFVGRISYGLYLWHWPIFLVLNEERTGLYGYSLFAVRFAITFCIAVLSWYLVETPVRQKRFGGWRSWAWVPVGAVTIVGVLFVTTVTITNQAQKAFAAEQAAAARAFFGPCVTLVPSNTELNSCVGGDLASSTVVVLVGDSHAGAWFRALSDAAKSDAMRLVGVAEPGCPAIPVQVIARMPIDTQQCVALRQQFQGLLADLKPKAVILTQHDGYLGEIMDKNGTVPAREVQIGEWRQAYASFLNSLRRADIRPAVILDNPTLPGDPSACLAQRGSIRACEPSRPKALEIGRPLQAAELQVLRQQHVPFFAPDTVLCDRNGCPLELNGKSVYMDNNHLTSGATFSMEPQLRMLLEEAISRTG